MFKIYSEKIKDPNSKAVTQSDPFLICFENTKHQWFIVESAWSMAKAIKVKELFNNQEIDNNRDPCYAVFDRKSCIINNKID